MLDGYISSAVISDCSRYRYVLSRPSELADPTSGTALFVMLNPSTADAKVDDPTIRRCRAFARTWGCAGIKVLNLYAYRATNPAELKTCGDPIGPDNDSWLLKLAINYRDVVFAWGANAEPERAAEVVDIFRRGRCRMLCLGTTKSGAPRHPLYVKGDTQLAEYIHPGSPIEKGPCLRCRQRVHVLGCRWCKDCYYPGIDEVYNKYRALLDEGCRRVDAAVRSGWKGAEEI